MSLVSQALYLTPFHARNRAMTPFCFGIEVQLNVLSYVCGKEEKRAVTLGKSLQPR